jgi:hypothetical protein
LRTTHQSSPIGVAMAGADTFDPYNDWRGGGRRTRVGRRVACGAHEVGRAAAGYDHPPMTTRPRERT